MSREIMQQALDALEYHTMQTRPISHTDKAIEALEAALAQPEQEPPKREWVGLTDEQLSETYNELYTQYTRDDVNIADFILIARTIESQLKEKNT